MQEITAPLAGKILKGTLSSSDSDATVNPNGAFRAPLP